MRRAFSVEQGFEYLLAFFLGFKEGDGDWGVTWGDFRDECYDWGRSLRRGGRLA
jgi:hypothetical protein